MICSSSVLNTKLESVMSSFSAQDLFYHLKLNKFHVFACKVCASFYILHLMQRYLDIFKSHFKCSNTFEVDA